MTEKQLITVLDNKDKDSYNIALTELIKNLTTRPTQSISKRSYGKIYNIY